MKSMGNKKLKITHIFIVSIAIIAGLSSAKYALALGIYKPFGGRVIMTETTPTINCYGSTGDITTTGTHGQSTQLVIPPGTRMGKQPQSGKWILGLHLRSTTPACTIGEYPYETTYNVYIVKLYGVSKN